jgi:hypothetical protein
MFWYHFVATMALSMHHWCVGFDKTAFTETRRQTDTETDRQTEGHTEQQLANNRQPEQIGIRAVNPSDIPTKETAT